MLPDGTEAFYFSGMDGKRLGTYVPYVSGSGVLYFQQGSTNLYFAGKLVRSNDQGVATDRVGSVIATLPDTPTGVFPYGAVSLTYYPHGEERQTTAQNQEKFATYYRDGSGLDYADQRYYASNFVRFLTPSPMKGASLSEPGSWNGYAYVQGDPVNFNDPAGKICLRRNWLVRSTALAYM